MLVLLGCFSQGESSACFFPNQWRAFTSRVSLSSLKRASIVSYFRVGDSGVPMSGVGVGVVGGINIKCNHGARWKRKAHGFKGTFSTEIFINKHSLVCF